MLNGLRDGQLNYGTGNCPSVHVPPHNVVAPIHQNSLMSSEPTAPVVYPWNSNPRLENLYGFHSRYYNLDFPTPYPPATNQYVPTNMYGQNVPQCCQPCCRLRSQNIPKTSPPQVLYNPIRPVQQLNRSYKSKKTLKTPCSEQFLPYIPNDLPVKYDTQNCYQQKYNNSFLNSTNYCPPPSNNLWIPPAANPTWPTDRLRPIDRHAGTHVGMGTHDFTRDKNYQRLPNYQNNLYSSNGATHHRPYNYAPPVPDVSDYRSSVYHNQLKTNASDYVPHEHNSRLPTSSLSNQSVSSVQQFYNTQSVAYTDVQRPNESFKPQISSQNVSKSNLNVREFLENWDEGEEETTNEKSAETATPIVVLDCMTLEGDALTKIQEKLNVVSYENLEKVLKENQNPLFINSESNEIDVIQNKSKTQVKPNFEPLDYTKRETGIIKPFITEKKTLPETNTQSEKNYSVNFDGMVAWYGKKNTDISSTDLIERLADRIFNLSKSQENEGVSFGTAAYTGQITQTNRPTVSPVKNQSKFIQSQQMYNLQHQTEKCMESPDLNKIDCNNDSISRMNCCVSNESNKISAIKSNNINLSCIVENTTKRCLDLSNTNVETTSWNLDQGSQEQHLNMSLYDHSVIIKPIDFSSLTDETKDNPFVFDKNTSINDKSSNNINDQFNKELNENNDYNSTISNNRHPMQQIDSGNRNFPVIVSPHIHKQEYNGFHESVIQRTGCDKNKHDKISTHTDFEGMNWNISNDLDKIMKNTNMSIESPFLYDRNNYNILDSMNSDKNVSTQWKNSAPCVDLTINSKASSNHDSFFDGWNFIESYENQTNKKLTNSSSDSNEVHNSLFSNQITSLNESGNKNNNMGKKIENETLVTMKDVSYSKPSDLSSSSTHSRDVFNLNNRIPDFGDGFELTTTSELHEYMQFKKSSNDNEHRTDGSIFEHLTEPKCIRTMNETIHIKNDHNKPDMVGLPSFKEKEPLAPVPVPPKLNIVKPIIRDPSQIHSVIKQKLKYDSTSVDNGNIMLNKTGHCLKNNQINTFNGSEMKPKYNNEPLNQFDVWSEKFVLKGNSNNLTSSVIQCDVEITQFKSTSENRNTSIPKPNLNNSYDKNLKLPENTNCNLSESKINDKINSNDFLNCLENTKTDDQKYRDTLDEFETSFGFDISCNNEPNKSFHEDIIDKCLEERINDQIGEHNINSSHSTDMSNNNTKSLNNTQLPFQCDFQSGYLIKNYFDENKNKTTVLDQKPVNNNKTPSTNTFNYHSEIEHNFELQSNKNILHTAQSSQKNSDFNILNNPNCDIKQIKHTSENRDSNFTNKTGLKLFESNHENVSNCTISDAERNNFSFLTLENRSFEFENNNKRFIESISSDKVIEIDNNVKPNDICKINYSNNSDVHELTDIQKRPTSVDFELNTNHTNIFETKLNIDLKSATAMNENRESENTNNFGSTFHTENTENIENHNISSKNILELENNNSDLYQTQNLEKIADIDFKTKIVDNFETKIVDNFEMKCSSRSRNVQESASTKEIFIKEHQTNIEYNYEMRSREINEQEVLKNALDNPAEEHLVNKISNLDCNDNTQFHNIETETKNIELINKVEHVFEIDRITSNTQEKYNNDFNVNISNENVNEINLRNNSTHDGSNTNNNIEVEKMFENLYDNLTDLSSEKDDSKKFENNYQVEDKFDTFKSLEKTNNQTLNIQNSEIIKEQYDKTQINECLSEPVNIFIDTDDNDSLEKCVNISNSHLTTEFLQQNQLLDKDNICEHPTTKKHCTSVSETPTLSKNFLNTPNKVAVCENITTFQKQQIVEIQHGKVELPYLNNIQTPINITVNSVQGELKEKMFENIESDSSNTKLITGITTDKKSEDDLCDPIEIISQQHSQDIVETKDPTTSKSSLSIELNSQPNTNKIVDIDNSLNSSPSNHVNIIDQQYSNVISEVRDSTNFKSSLLNSVEPTNMQHLNEIVDIQDAIYSKSDSLDLSILTCKQLSNTIVDVEDKIESKSNLLNYVENSPNLIAENKDFTSSNKPSLSDINRIASVGKNNEFDINNIEPSSSKRIKFENQNHVIEIVEPKIVKCTKYDSFNIDKLICHQICDKTIEIESSNNFKPNLLNILESENHQQLNKIVEIENNTHCDTSSLNDVESTRQEHLIEISQNFSNLKSLTLIEENVLKTNENIYVNNTDFKSNTDELKLPRVKFILKSHNRSVIKTNIFDKEPIPFYKKLNISKDENLIAGNIFKKRNKFYKPWRNIPKKQSIDTEHTLHENDNAVAKTICQQTTTIIPNILNDNLENIKCHDYEGEKRDNNEIALEINEVAHLEEFNILEEEQQLQCDDIFKTFKNEELADKNTCNNNTNDDIDDEFLVGEEHVTPVPSPFDDFLSCRSTPEFNENEEYWDKSLENKYKNVLYKTISKLTPKTRVNIRNKFNMRLLARKIIEIKRNKRQLKSKVAKKRVNCNEVEASQLVTVIDDFSAVLPTTVLRCTNSMYEKPINPKCKIKVQLPWGRIFNLKNSRPEDLQNSKTKDTKLELGPAKVEVRLSQTPGEWQVAASCTSDLQSNSTVLSVKRLVLQRATSPTITTDDYQDKDFTSSSSSSNCDIGDYSSYLSNNCQQRDRNSRKLPKIVIRRNGQDNYTSYVSTVSGGGVERGGDNESSGDDDIPRLMVRLVRDRKLDAMAADGITTLHLKHLVPITESAAEEDTHGAKRVRYT